MSALNQNLEPNSCFEAKPTPASSGDDDVNPQSQYLQLSAMVPSAEVIQQRADKLNDKYAKQGDGQITLAEFHDYYSNVSASIDNDEYF